MLFNNNDHQNEVPNEAFKRSYSKYRATRMGTMFFFASLISLFLRTMIFPFLFAPISIFFCYLAKGKRKTNDLINTLTIFFAVIVLVANSVYCGYVVYSVDHDTAFHRQMENYAQEFYGMSLEEYMEQVQQNFQNPGGVK